MDSEDGDTPKIWYQMPHISPVREKFAKNCISELQKCSKKELRFLLTCMYDKKKVTFLLSYRDPVPVSLQSHVIYQFECLGCKAKCIGKMDRCLKLRLWFPILVIEYVQEINDLVWSSELIIKLKPKAVER